MRAKSFLLKELGASKDYTRPIGMMEMFKFRQLATPEQLKQMKILIATDTEAAWRLLQQVTKTNLDHNQHEMVTEIDMSPSSLKKLAQGVDAMAGMEFEMIVYGFGIDDGEGEAELDFDVDERPTSIDDIITFFNGGEGNSASDLRILNRKLTADFEEWVSDYLEEEWVKNGKEHLAEFLADDFDEETTIEDAKEELGDDASEDEIQEKVEELRQEWIDSEWDRRGRNYDRARDDWFESQDREDLQSDWLRDQGIRTMINVYQEYDIPWPYIKFQESDLEENMDALAKRFSKVINRKVFYSTEYHGASRQPDAYSVEPDGSLEVDEPSMEAGIEFISPPLPVTEMLSDLRKVIDWAVSNNYETNESTGLHMNVSVKNYSKENLDYIKLALLLGDQHVLEVYGREANTYTKSSVQQMQRTKERASPEQMAKMFEEMRNGLSKLANKVLTASISGNKYVSINAKSSYVEFRSPGGDWLSININQLENTLLRFVVALDAACDPQKYKKEYLKKLYQLLQPKSADDIITYFSNYVSGDLPKDQLIRLVRQKQLQRNLSKGKVQGNIVYNVYVKNSPNLSVGVVADSPENAIKKAIDEVPDWSTSIKYLLVAEPISYVKPSN
jgi:hypothetical protein